MISFGGGTQVQSFVDSQLKTQVNTNTANIGDVAKLGYPDVASGIEGHTSQLADLSANVKIFGAKGDGVTDDIAAIQNAIDSVDGGVILLPCGTYLISNTLYLKNNPKILMGKNATIKINTDNPIIRCQNTKQTITGINFDSTGRSKGIAIIVEGTSQQTEIFLNTFKNIPSSAINIQTTANDSKIYNNYFDSCGSVDVSPFNNVIYISDADDCMVTNNTMISCVGGVYFRGTTEINGYICEGNKIIGGTNAWQGISNQYPRNARIHNNYVVGFPNNAIDTFGSQFLSIMGNVIENCLDGVFVGDQNSNDITIVGNVFKDCHRGIRVFNSVDNNNVSIHSVTIANNDIYLSTEESILVSCTGTGSQMNGIIINGNRVYGNGKATNGIKVVGVMTTNIINNNIYRSKMEGIILDTCDLVQLDNNIIQDSSIAAVGTYSGIVSKNGNRNFIRNTLVYGSANYAVDIQGGSNHTVIGTRYRSVVNGINDLGTTTTKSDNIAV